MKVFLSYGYNDRDAWIPRLVRPIAEALGQEVLTGEQTFGTPIPAHVRDQIKRADALIAFLTRRDDANPAVTHRWVVEELAIAAAIPIPVVEVRETGVDEQSGIVGQFQRIAYDEGERDACVSRVAVALATLQRRARLRLQLLPEEFVREVRSLLNRPGTRCTYRYLDGATESQPFETRIIPLTGGVFCYTPNVPRDALVQIRFEAAGKAWISDYESAEALNVYVREE